MGLPFSRRLLFLMLCDGPMESRQVGIRVKTSWMEINVNKTKDATFRIDEQGIQERGVDKLVRPHSGCGRKIAQHPTTIFTSAAPHRGNATLTMGHGTHAPAEVNKDPFSLNKCQDSTILNRGVDGFYHVGL
jgi:hypothetical protein